MSNFLGSCINQGTHKLTTGWAYRIPLLVICFVPLLIFGLTWIVPESPRWLITMDKTEEAKANLKKLRGPTYTEDEIVEEIDQCVKFTELESSLESSSSYVECFKGTDRRRTMIAMLMMMGQQCQGTAFLAGYITYFFGLVSDQDPFISAVIATSMAITGTLVAIPIIKYVPRRTLLLVGAVVSGSCMLLFAIVNEAAPGSPTASKFIIACICIFSFSYSASWGSLGPVIVGEIGSNRLRTKTVAIGTGAGFLLALIVITTIPYLIGATYANLGTRVGFVFGGLTVLIMVVTYFYLPETKDRTLEELDEMFINGVSTHGFKTYVCTREVTGITFEKVFETKGASVSHSGGS